MLGEPRGHAEHGLSAVALNELLDSAFEPDQRPSQPQNLFEVHPRALRTKLLEPQLANGPTLGGIGVTNAGINVVYGLDAGPLEAQR